MTGCWLDSRSSTVDASKIYGVRNLGVIGELISLEQARDHLNVDLIGSPPASPKDSWITTIGIPSARAWCEGFTGGSIAPQSIEVTTQGFPAATIPLPFGPIISVTSVSYTDADGVYQAMDAADYELDVYARPNVIRPVFGGSWPTARSSTNSVRVLVVAGYSLPGDSPQVNPLPAAVMGAMLLMLGHYFNNTDDTIAEERVTIQSIPSGAASLLEPYRIRLSIA